MFSYWNDEFASSCWRTGGDNTNQKGGKAISDVEGVELNLKF